MNYSSWKYDTTVGYYRGVAVFGRPTLGVSTIRPGVRSGYGKRKYPGIRNYHSLRRQPTPSLDMTPVKLGVGKTGGYRTVSSTSNRLAVPTIILTGHTCQKLRTTYEWVTCRFVAWQQRASALLDKHFECSSDGMIKKAKPFPRGCVIGGFGSARDYCTPTPSLSLQQRAM